MGDMPPGDSAILQNLAASRPGQPHGHAARREPRTSQAPPEYHATPENRQPSDSPQLAQNLRQEVLEAKGDIAVTVVVVAFKYVGHALEADAGLDEQVEAHDALVALVVGAEEDLDEAFAQAVAEGDERVAELVQADVAGPVRVKAVEERPPRGQEGPQAAELLEADRAAAVAVEHADHHAHRLRVERRPVAVDQRRREFPLRELPGTCTLEAEREHIVQMPVSGRR